MSLKRLAELCGANEATIRNQFVDGMPEDVVATLQGNPRIIDMSDYQLLKLARSLVRKHAQPSGGASAAVAQDGTAGSAADERALQSSTTASANAVAPALARPPGRRYWGCYYCGQVGHIKKKCPGWLSTPAG